MRSKTFCTREVCRLSGMSASAVRALARAHIVGVRRGRSLQFDFRDLRVLRMGAGLVRAGLSLSVVQETFVCLQKQARRQKVPLSSMGCSREQFGVVATLGEARWLVSKGQMRPYAAPMASSHMSAPSALLLASHSTTSNSYQIVGDSMVRLLAHLPGHRARNEADEWFTQALAVEDDDPQAAYQWYMRALACDPEHVEAILNVGRLCFADDDLPRASAFFRLAVRIDAAHPIAHFNLAVALQDSGKLVEAARSYRRALLFDRNLADAHFNLGTLLGKIGRHDEAEHHFAQYRAALLRRS